MDFLTSGIDHGEGTIVLNQIVISNRRQLLKKEYIH